MKTSYFLPVVAGLVLAPVAALAQEPTAVDAVAPAMSHWGLAWAACGAAIATFVSCMGSIMGVSIVGQAGSGLLTEKPGLAGKVITLAVLPGSQGLYGMVISLLFMFNFTPVLTGETAITAGQGLAIMFACMPVAFTCLTSGPFQSRVCAAGMHMLAKDDKLTGRVITLAALVETYALLGFLVSFFMLNYLNTNILGA